MSLILVLSLFLIIKVSLKFIPTGFSTNTFQSNFTNCKITFLTFSGDIRVRMSPIDSEGANSNISDYYKEKSFQLFGLNNHLNNHQL